MDQHQIYGENFKVIDHMTISVLCKDSSSIRVLQLHILKSGKAEGVSKCINPSLESVFFYLSVRFDTSAFALYDS